MSEWIDKVGALFAALFASICCFAPLLARATGIAAVAAIASLAIYRPYFIGLAGLALVYSLFTTFWKKYRGGSLHPGKYEFGKEEFVLSATTVLVFFAILFPYLRGVDPLDGARTYGGRGAIVELDRSEGSVTLAHGEVEGLLPAMTMDYDVERSGLLDGLKSGDQVYFRLRPQGINFVVVEIRGEKKP